MWTPAAARHDALVKSIEHLTEAVKAQTMALNDALKRECEQTRSLVGRVRDELKDVRESQIAAKRNGNGAFSPAVKKTAPPVGYAAGGAGLVELVRYLMERGA